MLGILEHFGLSGYFNTVVTSRDVNQPNPHQICFTRRQNVCNWCANELLFVGDSELDQAAAKSAGMPFAAYRGDLQADLRLEHHEELVALFVSA